MTIDHIAIWVNDLENMKQFYVKYFGATTNQKYHNPKKNFNSYFLTIESGARLELMQKPEIPQNLNNTIDQYIGLNHFAVSVGSKNNVDELTEKLRNDGYEVIGEPRTTGDGYYESVVFDPEKNRIEITI